MIKRFSENDLKNILFDHFNTGGGARIGGIFYAECFDKNGNIKWVDYGTNLVTNVGLQHILDILFVSATTQIDPWYMGLVNGPGSGTSYAAADTLASHSGWTENSNYSGNRKEYVDVRSSQSVTNSASKASFSITSDSQTIAGAFLASVSTSTTGTLLCAADFSGGDKSADSGDTLEVTYTFSVADDGA